jgi:hypothetical protein
MAIIYIARFKTGVLSAAPQRTNKTLAEMQAIKAPDTCFEITQTQWEQLTDGWVASESGGVVTVTEPAGWLENKTNEAWEKIRKERNQLLGESDYIILADAPVDETQKQEWTTYRQALRDIPQDYDSPDEVVYPDKPE